MFYFFAALIVSVLVLLLNYGIMTDASRVLAYFNANNEHSRMYNENKNYQRLVDSNARAILFSVIVSIIHFISMLTVLIYFFATKD